MRLLPPSLPASTSRASRGWVARVLAGLLMLVHLGVAAAAPVADGLVDHDAKVVTHVEDANGGDCPAQHGSEACDLCQLAQAVRVVPSATPLVELPPAARTLVAVAARVDAPVAFGFLAGRASRAPPLG